MGKFVGRLMTCVVVALIASFTGVKSSEADDNSLQAGAWALQFEVDGDFDLGAFQGSTISVKKQTSDGSALRIGFDLSLSASTDETNEDESRTSYSSWEFDGTELGETDRNRQSIAITIQKVFYPNPDANINVFYGLGPTARVIHDKRTTQTHVVRASTLEIGGRDSTIFSSTSSYSSTSSQTWSGGVRVVFGAEWFASRTISLLAEYGTGLTYDWGDSESVNSYRSDNTRERRQSVRTTDSNGFSLAAGAVKFGLSVYF